MVIVTGDSWQFLRACGVRIYSNLPDNTRIFQTCQTTHEYFKPARQHTRICQTSLHDKHDSNYIVYGAICQYRTYWMEYTSIVAITHVIFKRMDNLGTEKNTTIITY